MSQQVKVEDEIVFAGGADYSANVKGHFMPKKVILHDHFLADHSEQDWVEEETNGGTATQTAANGGTVVLAAGATADDDCIEFSHAAQWSGSKNCVMEARVHMDAITAIGVNIGWADADMSTNDQICYELTGVALTDARVTDGAAFVFDTDGTTNVWYCCAVKADAEGTPATFTGKTNGATTAPVASTYATFRVALNTDGDATFYYNGECVGHQATAVTAATLQCPYVGLIARENAAKNVTIDRITCWQDE
jgi:hypothetical protein